jgi:hypothetical protein
MTRLAGPLLALALLAVGCSAGEGGTCDVAADCREGLSCVAWDELHSEVLGKCDGDNCCVGEQRRRKVWDALREQRLASRSATQAQCKRLTAAIRKGRSELKRALRGDAAAKANAAATVDESARRLSRLELADEVLLRMRDDYVGIVKDVARAMRAMARARDERQEAVAAGAWSRLGPRKEKIVDELKKYCAL